MGKRKILGEIKICSIKKNLFMMKKLILFTIIGIFLISLTSALTFQRETDVNLYLTCISNDSYCSGSAICNISITNPSMILLIDNVAMTNNGCYHNISLNATHTANNGEYAWTMYCNDSGTTGVESGTFMITPNGTIPTTAQGIMYSFLMIICITILSFCIYGGAALKGDNEFHMGKLISINFIKYVKMGLFFLSYLFFIFVFYLAWQISANFLWITAGSDIFRLMFIILWIILAPLFIAFVIIALVKFMADLRLEELAKRNLRTR